MKLRFTPDTNYIHKVLVAAHMTGVLDRLEFMPTRPRAPDTDLHIHNPLSKVPTLILDDGETLYGGPLICEYFDSLNKGPKIFPPTGRERFRTVRQMVLAEVMFETLSMFEGERRQPEPMQRIEWMERSWLKITRGLDQMERDVDTFDPLTIGPICTAGLLSRLDYRIHTMVGKPGPVPMDFNWRTGHPRLKAWYDKVKVLPAMTFTVPQPPGF